MRSQYVPPETLSALERRMQRANALALRVSAATGLRIGDVLALPCSALEGTTLHYVAQKTGKEGAAKLPPSLARQLRAAGDGEHLFPGRKPGTTRSRQAVYRDLKRACDLLGVAGQVSPHTARKVYAVELRKAEGIEAVQRALQHSSRDITLPYAYADLMQSDNTGVEAAKLELLAEMIADKVLRRLVQNNTNGCSGIDKPRPEA